MRILWLGRQIPIPLTSGDRIYTAKLVESVAQAGCSIVFLGLPAADGADPAELSPAVEWRAVAGGMAPQYGFLLSRTLPMVAVRHRTAAYRKALRQALAEGPWDAIVLDQYGMVWCIDEIVASGFRGVLAHVSHDFETKVTRDVAVIFKGNPVTKAILTENGRRTALAERRLANACGLVTAITDEDRGEFERIGSAAAYVTLKPGYDGRRRASRTLDASLPRRAVMLGSFDWLPKRLNLIAFLTAADQRFAEAGIELRVIGAASEQLRAEIAPHASSVRMLGFVDDPAEEFDKARLALVFEETGGGFKLKMLDYIFNRLPLFGLDHGITGLPDSVRAHVAIADVMAELVTRVIRDFDRFDALNAMQNGAFDAASAVFSWDRTARIFLDGVEKARSARA